MNETITHLKDLVAFLNLIVRYRDENAETYNRLAPDYDRVSKMWNQTFARAALNSLFTEVYARIPHGGKVLDAGCGTGNHTQQLLDWLDPAELLEARASPQTGKAGSY